MFYIAMIEVYPVRRKKLLRSAAGKSTRPVIDLRFGHAASVPFSILTSKAIVGFRLRVVNVPHDSKDEGGDQVYHPTAQPSFRGSDPPRSTPVSWSRWITWAPPMPTLS